MAVGKRCSSRLFIVAADRGAASMSVPHEAPAPWRELFDISTHLRGSLACFLSRSTRRRHGTTHVVTGSDRTAAASLALTARPRSQPHHAPPPPTGRSRPVTRPRRRPPVRHVKHEVRRMNLTRREHVGRVNGLWGPTCGSRSPGEGAGIPRTRPVRAAEPSVTRCRGVRADTQRQRCSACADPHHAGEASTLPDVRVVPSLSWLPSAGARTAMSHAAHCHILWRTVVMRVDVRQAHRRAHITARLADR